MKRLIIILLFLPVYYLAAQSPAIFDCESIENARGFDIAIYDRCALSGRLISPNILAGGELVFCPKGMFRSSQDDIKRRWKFNWASKYNNIYIRTSDGLVVEGINEHGFSAALIYLENSQLPGKEKELIPIESSLAVNFFIDHFKSIDTALLAIWDTRIYDNIGASCGWPFRIVLHDSTGASAYIEHVEGKLRVYTPEPPSVICDGPDYNSLLMVKHLEDHFPSGIAERNFFYLDSLITANPVYPREIINDYVQAEETISQDYLWILRSHKGHTISLSGKGMDYNFDFDQKNFDQAGERVEKIF